jgi:hypothetical protein
MHSIMGRTTAAYLHHSPNRPTGQPTDRPTNQPSPVALKGDNLALRYLRDVRGTLALHK